MTSKYAIALYEMVALRANMNRCVELFPLDRFRELLVLLGAYDRSDNFQRFVIKPALLEVNGLSDMGVQIEMVRRHPRAPAHEVTVTWWRKEGDEFRAAMQERGRSWSAAWRGCAGRLRRSRQQGESLPRWTVPRLGTSAQSSWRRPRGLSS